MFLAISIWLVISVEPNLAISNWFERWQTILTGLLALFAARYTVAAIREQIAAQRDIEVERRRREEFAARSALPVALSALCQYSKQCVDELYAVKASTSQTLSLPKIPDAIIATIRDCMRFADREYAEQMADLLAWLQIQSARLEGLSSDLGSQRTAFKNREIDRRIRDAAMLYGRASALFDYGRHHRKIDELSEEHVKAAMFNMGRFDYGDDDE